MNRKTLWLEGNFEEFKPGDPPPVGYLAWHEWADVQAEAGLKQTKCCVCGKWKFPQELSPTVTESIVRTKRGKSLTLKNHYCLTCEQTLSEKPV